MDLKKMFNYWLRAYQTKFTFQLFNGRATREEFWGFMVFQLLLIQLPVELVGEISDEVWFVLALVEYVLTFIPFYGMCSRRLHDCGASGYPAYIIALMSLFSLLPLEEFFDYESLDALDTIATFFPLFLLLALGCIPSKKGDNEYGPDPHAQESEA